MLHDFHLLTALSQLLQTSVNLNNKGNKQYDASAILSVRIVSSVTVCTTVCWLNRLTNWKAVWIIR